jgi:DNA-binding NarL/FixJ family response regulator
MGRSAPDQRRSQQMQAWVCHGPSRVASLPQLTPTIRIVIAHRHEAFRVGLCALLDGESDLQVVGQAADAEEMLSEARRTRTNVIFLGSGLSNDPESHIYKALVYILPSVQIIRLMKDVNAQAFRDAIKAGAQGYLPENPGRGEVIRAIRTVTKGGLFFVLSSPTRPPVY